MPTRREQLDENATVAHCYTHGGRSLLVLAGKVELISLQKIYFDNVGAGGPDGDLASYGTTRGWSVLAELGEQALVCDLTDVTYIELPALLYLNGLVAVDRKVPESGRRKTKLILPSDPDVLKFLLRWNYLRSFADAVYEKDFSSVLVGRHPEYLKLAAEVASAVEYTLDPQGKSVRLLPRSYYEFKSFLHPQTLSINLAEDIADAWNEPHVIDVLTKVMGDDLGPWLAHNVIWQLLENALIHPNATLIQHCAQHERRTYMPLKVGLWDNGESIITTLRAALKEGDAIGPAADITDVEVEVHLKERQQRGPAKTVMPFTLTKEQLKPKADDPDWRILLCSLMPGVSGRAHLAGVSDMLGLGLHRIAISTTRKYGGEFIIRTNDILIVVRPAQDRPELSYAVDVELLTDQADAPLTLTGNLLAVSLPPHWT